jgi:aminoglycoside 3-N-acetyltransferase
MKSPAYLSLPEIGRERLIGDFRALGLRSGDSVFVHSSLSRIGNVAGGAAGVVDALLEAVGDEGTLAVPTIPYRGSMRAFVAAENLFDVQSTPSLMGAISESVRRHPRALRSREPSHPVAAIGPQAPFLIREHRHSVSPCDEHSPYYRLRLVDAWYLLLGVDFHSCTLLHGAEEIARVPFLDLTTLFEIPCRDGGEEYVARIACHSTHLRANFPAIEPALAARGLLTHGQVGCATCRLARAGDILATALEELARNPYFLRQPNAPRTPPQDG